jgi:hypothetical protein
MNVYIALAITFAVTLPVNIWAGVKLYRKHNKYFLATIYPAIFSIGTLFLIVEPQTTVLGAIGGYLMLWGLLTALVRYVTPLPPKQRRSDWGWDEYD